jgi:hypothetical protein
MSYASDQKDPETFKIIPRRETIKYLNIAIIAGGPSEMKDPQ